MKKLNHAKTDDTNIKWYIKNVSSEAARTIFEVRSNMVKIDSNYGKPESQCCMRGQNETTRHLFECEDDLTIDIYNKIMKDGGPREEKTVLEEYAARIQREIQLRKPRGDMLEIFILISRSFKILSCSLKIHLVPSRKVCCGNKITS